MFRVVFQILALCLCIAPQAEAKDVFDAMPAPIAAFARDLDRECQSSKLGHVIKSDNYRSVDLGMSDIDRDGKADYIVYKCMFGCSEKPAAFTAAGSPCPYGSMLLSGQASGKGLFIPGVVNEIFQSDPVTMVITRPKTLRFDSTTCIERGPAPTFDPQHLYKLQGSKILLVDKCPSGGCSELAANFPQLSPMPTD